MKGFFYANSKKCKVLCYTPFILVNELESKA